ncbi:MAG: ROK family protein [Aigarchaeota archaeon]|nr:ROK family protein [Candidatus Pelearchaeum maunauluense]
MELVAALDIGASWTRVAAARPSGELLAYHTYPTPRDADEIQRLISNSLNILKSEVSVSEFRAVGIASVGPLSARDGMILGAPNIGGVRVSVGDAVKRVHDGLIVMLNDCNAAVLGERIFGAGRGARNIAYVTISTGIGGGAIVDGTLLLGKDGNAAEVGHTVVDYKYNVKCGCGGYGHWESFCSGRGLLRLARLVLGSKYARKWRKPEQLFTDARRRDKRALKLLEEVAKINAAGFANVINSFDPEIMTIGGSVALNNTSLVIDWAVRYLRRYILNRPPIIMPTPLGEKAPLMGAVAAALNPIEEAIVR